MEMPPPRIIREQLTRSELVTIASNQFGDMVKAVVDIERGIMALGGELHSDEEAVLLDDGSSQRKLWGINLYPSADEADWIEYDSMINVRPSQGNRTRGVEDAELRAEIRRIVNELIEIMENSARGHANLAAGRWTLLSLVEQLANVGSEVDRAIKAQAAGLAERRDAAVNRGLELFDLTAADNRWRGPRRREILREAREEFCDNSSGPDRAAWRGCIASRYFLHFAVAARRASGRD